MKKYIVKECVYHFHEIDIDDELNIESVINKAKSIQYKNDWGHEALIDILQRYEKKYGFDFKVIPDNYGIESIDIEAIDIVE